ncbi:hypothetical protein JCM21900_003824 [Sporobolomyces salmonicolor]
MPPKLTNPLRPVARYRKGKAPVNAQVASDSDEESDDQHRELEDDRAPLQEDEDLQEFTTAAQRKQPAGASAGGRINVALREVEVDQAGKVRVGGRDEVGRTEMESSEGEYETESEDEAPKAIPKPVFNQPTAPAEEDEGSSEYETDSSEEPLAPIYKPVFVSKRNRDTIAEREKELDPSVVEERRQAEIQKQKEQSKNLVAESIVRELAEKEAPALQPEVDDTDGLDPEGEFEEWKLRELQRLKRDREARYALEKVREEVEARRAMPEALRLKEDLERAKKSREEKKKGSQVFLQKYHHKGAFHQDLEILKKHDYTAPTEAQNVDVSALPAVMQKRNFGKAHQTKYTHLADQDTSRQSGGWGAPTRPLGGPGGNTAGGEGCFVCGGPHLKRDCPQLADPALAGPSGANSAAFASTSTSRDSGWGARRPPPRGEEDRYAAGPPSRGGDDDRGARAGRRGGPGLGYGGGGRRDDGDPSGRDAGRDRGGGGGGGGDRRRSRSPLPRYRGREGGDDDRVRRSGAGYDDRDRRYGERERRRSRSRSWSRDRGGGGRGGPGTERDRDGGRERGGDRDDDREKRRRVD